MQYHSVGPVVVPQCWLNSYLKTKRSQVRFQQPQAHILNHPNNRCNCTQDKKIWKSKRTLKPFILCSQYISMIFLTIIRASIAFGLLLLTHLTEKQQKWTEEAKWQISSHFFLSWRRIHLSLLGSHLFGLIKNNLFSTLPRRCSSRLVERPSEVPAWCNSTKVDSNHAVA